MKRLPLAISLLVFSLVLLWNLDVLNVTIMEARNFVTAREMVDDGNYLLPTLNDEYRLQKPPLPTWMTSAVTLVSGSQDVFWLRLPAVFLGLLSLLFGMKIVQKLSRTGTDPILSGAVLLTSFYFFLTARSGMWDIFAQGFTLVAIYYYICFFMEHRGRCCHGLLFGLCLAASFMSKGPVALYGLFLPFLISFHWICRDDIVFNRGKIKVGITALILAILLSLAWPLYIYFSEAGVAAAQIIKTESQNWTNYHVKPFYHYWTFPIQSGIWAVYGFIGLVAYAISYGRLKENKALRFYFWWTLMVVILLSLIPEKKERYLLPVLFPLAMFIAELVQHSSNRLVNIAVNVAGWITSICLVLLGIILLIGYPAEIDSLPLRHLGGFVLIACGGFAIVNLMNRNARKAVYSIAAAVMAFILLFVGSTGRLLNDTKAINSFERLATDAYLSELPLYSTLEMRPELVWKIGRKAPVLWSCELPQADVIGVFSYDGIETELDSTELLTWDVIQEELFDQNPVSSIKKPNVALKRYFAILKKKD